MGFVLNISKGGSKIKLKSRQLTQVSQVKILWGDNQVKLIFQSSRNTVRYNQRVTMKDMNKKETVIYSIEVILRSIRRKISKRPDLVILKQSAIQLKYLILKEKLEVKDIKFTDFNSDIREKNRKKAIKITEGKALLNFLLYEYNKKAKIGKLTLSLVDQIYERKYLKKILANYSESLPFSIHPEFLIAVKNTEMKELMIYLVDETIIWNELLKSNRNIEDYIIEMFCTIYDINQYISGNVKTLTDTYKNIIFKMANNALYKNSLLGNLDKFQGNAASYEIGINIFQIARNEILISKTFEAIIKKKKKFLFSTVSGIKNNSNKKIDLVELWESSIIEYPKLNILSKIIEFNTLLVNRVLEIDPISFEKVDLNVLESVLLIALGFRNSIMESVHIFGIPFDILTVPSLLGHLVNRFDELKEYITHLRDRDDYSNWLARLLIMYAPGWQHLSPETDLFNINNYWDLIDNEKLGKNVQKIDKIGIE